MKNRPRLLSLAVLTLLVNGSVNFAADDRELPMENERGDQSQPLWVYVSVSGENRIACYHLARLSGELKFRESVELDGAPGCLALSRDGKHVYAALRSTKQLGTFRLDAQTGSLSQQATVDAVDNPVYIAPDAGGNFLLTAYYAAGKAAVYPILENGQIGADPVCVLTTKKNPHSILADSRNRHVYVPNTGSDVILHYGFDAESGLLTPATVPEVATGGGTGPRHLFFHPKLPVLYVVNEKSSSVSSFAIDKATGDLMAQQTLSTLPTDYAGRNTCADIEVTPDGRFVYCSNRGHDSIAGFAVDASTGELTAVGQSATEKTPRSFNVDPTGAFLVAAGQGSGRLAVYRRKSHTGALQPLEVYEVGASPAWVLIVDLAQNGGAK